MFCQFKKASALIFLLSNYTDINSERSFSMRWILKWAQLWSLLTFIFTSNSCCWIRWIRATSKDSKLCYEGWHCQREEETWHHGVVPRRNCNLTRLNCNHPQNPRFVAVTVVLIPPWFCITKGFKCRKTFFTGDFCLDGSQEYQRTYLFDSTKQIHSRKTNQYEKCMHIDDDIYHTWLAAGIFRKISQIVKNTYWNYI